MSIFETFLCANFQQFETFHPRARGAAARDRAGAPACAPRAGAAAASRRAPGARRRGARPRRRPSRSPAIWRVASSVATLRMPSCTMAPSCASCPNGPWRCSTRQSVRGFARCRKASGLCRAASSASARLQNAHRGSCRSRPSSVSVVLFASKAAVPCVAARAGEAQRVARQRLAAHAATQGTRALSLSGVRGHAGYAQDVCGEGRRA